MRTLLLTIAFSLVQDKKHMNMYIAHNSTHINVHAESDCPGHVPLLFPLCSCHWPILSGVGSVPSCVRTP